MVKLGLQLTKRQQAQQLMQLHTIQVLSTSFDQAYRLRYVSYKIYSIVITNCRRNSFKLSYLLTHFSRQQYHKEY